ncbi:MAG: phosphatidylserine/phosphatidylglycerophosphate/cardiolipin synthase family protein [Chromatiaceae bacterium]|jgi:CDP-diacylglycerol--glycerol-3-phosphate 3-phosphatidyltransferase/cardiolipin synthase|nr:phosphatidylserine/phosphatidylglycerophosphate/cardiolipin synthase family protein [Chromatiaceae bacterium]
MSAPSNGDLLRALADQAFTRSAGAELVDGNSVEVLCDARENYPAWEQAIAGARHAVALEMYIVGNDRTGRCFVDLLAERARAGVRVRVLYDWFGSLGAAWGRLFAPLVAAGGEVRAAARPGLHGPFGALARDHRKLLVVDDEVAFISGLCMADGWLGRPERGIPPWRDTGVAIRGPAVADAWAALAEAWRGNGGSLEPSELPAREAIARRGPVALRVIGTTPATAKLYRLDLLVASLAHHSLWLTDAYFMGTPVYLEALKQAARDGVDVRLLVPRSSDIPWIATVSRTLYRPLLDAGVRVFEWGGPMIHAKTAVADGRWARVGSSNLNLSSLFGNWELDVAVEDGRTAEALEEQFLRDLAGATEVVAGRRRRVVLSGPRDRQRPSMASALGSARGAARYAARLGAAVGAAVGGSRGLDATEAGALAAVGLVLMVVAALVWLFPGLIAVPLAVVLIWAGGRALWRAWRLRRRGADRT